MPNIQQFSPRPHYYARLIIYILIIFLILALLFLPPFLYNNNDHCTIRCQRINNDAAWDDCMLQCHGAQQ